MKPRPERQGLRRQDIFGDGQHVLDPLEKPAEFVAGLGDRLAHLARDLGGDGLLVTMEIIEAFPYGGHAFRQRPTAPFGGGLPGGLSRGVNSDQNMAAIEASVKIVNIIITKNRQALTEATAS